MARSLSTREASNLLGFSSRTVMLRLIHTVCCERSRDGSWMIDENDLIELLRSHPLTDR